MTFRTNSFFALSVLCIFIFLVLPLFLHVLALFLSLLVRLLVLSLRTLLASSFVMSFPVLTGPPLLLLLLLLVPLLRLPLRGLIVCVGLLFRGLLRVMPLFPPFLLRRRGLQLRSSPPSISDVQFSSSHGFSLGPLVAASSVV